MALLSAVAPQDERLGVGKPGDLLGATPSIEGIVRDEGSGHPARLEVWQRRTKRSFGDKPPGGTP
jgi:hypothetical protein